MNYRRFTVLLTGEDMRAVQIVGAARCLAGKSPGVSPILRDLLRQERARLEARPTKGLTA